MNRFKPLGLLGVAALATMLVFAPAAQATKLKQQNLTQLISQAESIVAGTVRSVADGIDPNGVPYTEVTIAVGTIAKGKVKGGEDYTFRQFGLLEPRTFPDGRQLLAVSPEGFPRLAHRSADDRGHGAGQTDQYQWPPGQPVQQLGPVRRRGRRFRPAQSR